MESWEPAVSRRGRATVFELTLKADTWTRTVTIDALPCTVGAALTAGLSVAHVGWDEVEGVLEADGDVICFRPAARPLTPIPIIFAESFFIGDVEITAVRAQPKGFAFGHYDEAPATSSSIAAPTFRLAEPRGLAEHRGLAKEDPLTTDGAATRETIPRADHPAAVQSATPSGEAAGRSAQRSTERTLLRSTDGGAASDRPSASGHQRLALHASQRPGSQRPGSQIPGAHSSGERSAGPQSLGQRFGTREFHHELVEQLKKSPFFIVSALVHAAVFFAFALFMEQHTPDVVSALGSIKGTMDTTEELMGGNETDPVDVFEEPIHEEAEDLLESLDVVEPATSAPPPPDPREELPLPEEDMVEPPPAQLGLHPTATSFRRRTKKLRRKKPPVPTPANVAAGKLNQAFSTGRALDVNRASAKLVLDALGGRKTGSGAALDRLEREDVLVVEGGFDSIERVLDALHIPYTFSSPYNLIGRDALSLDSYKVVFWNCGESLLPHNRRRILSKIERFVRDGGYLFTTDWGVANVVTRAFPGYVRSRGDRNDLGELVVNIKPARGRSNHPLLEGVFLPKTQGKWWLERKSYDVRPGNKSKVEVLIEAPELREIHGISSVVAVTFPYGRGRVLHTIGHYYQKKGNLAGTIASHRLALNFVLMRMARHK